jgi:hypothetical protein
MTTDFSLGQASIQAKEEKRKDEKMSSASMVNVFLPDGIWAGQFMNTELAQDWIQSKGYKLDECEISQRSVDRETRKAKE